MPSLGYAPPDQQTRPASLSLAFAFVFVDLLGEGSLVLGTGSHVFQAGLKLAK